MPPALLGWYQLSKSAIGKAKRSNKEMNDPVGLVSAGAKFQLSNLFPG